MADYSKDFTISHGDDPSSCTIAFRCFDTPNSITVYGSPLSESDVEDLLITAFRECLEFHRLWSFSLAESDVSALNSNVDKVKVDPRTARLIELMADFHRIEPLFDFTIGPVSFLWKHISRIPTPEEVEAALELVGAEGVAVCGNVVEKADPRMKIDVGGAAKGFIADTVASRLRSSGVECADIDLGGNLFMVGKHPQGRPWRVAVKVPEGVEAAQMVLEVENQSVVTSGSYERYSEIDGVRYHHIVDPRTGWPSTSDVVSATVVSKSSLTADLLATTALLVGTSGVGELASRHPDCQIHTIPSY